MKYLPDKLNNNIGKEFFVAFLLFLLTAIYFNNLLFFKKLFLSGDLAMYFYPSRIYALNSFLNGSFPLWNTDIFCGAPNNADIQNAFYYPLTIFFYLFSAYFAITATYFIHIFMAGWFLYILMRHAFSLDRTSSFASAVIYMFSGFFTMHMGHLNQVMACAWTPLIILIYIKSIENNKLSYVISLGALFALQIFTGGIQNIFYLLIVLFLFSLYKGHEIYHSRKNIKECGLPFIYLLAGIIFGIALSAVQFLPTYELSNLSRRATGLSYAESSADSLAPIQFLISFFLPNYFGAYGKLTYWGASFPSEMSSYTGILPIMLSIYALYKSKERKYVCFFWSVAIIALIFALGKYTPLYTLFFEFGFNNFRSPARFIYIFVLSMAILAGFGMHSLFSKKKKSVVEQAETPLSGGATTKWSFRSKIANKNCAPKTQFYKFVLQSHADNSTTSRDSTTSIVLILFLLMATSSLLYYLTNYPLEKFHDMSLALDDYNALWYRDSFFTMISISVLLLIYTRFLSDSFKKVVFIAVIFFSLLNFISESEFHNASLNFDSDPINNRGEIIKYLNSDPSLHRIFRIGTSKLRPNTGIIHNIADIGGYGSGILPPQRYLEFFNRVSHRKDKKIIVNFELVDMLNVKYVISDYDIKISGYKKILKEGKSNLYFNENFVPRAFLVRSAVILENDKEILEGLSKKDLNFYDQVFIEKAPEFQGEESSEKMEKNFVNFKSYSTNVIEIETGLTKKGFLFVSDSWYPGWKVYIDDKPGEILRANYNFRGVALNKGLHQVRFEYKPPVFYAGLIISSLSFLFFLVVVSIRPVFLHRPPCCEAAPNG